ncbi:MAG: AAA family ATPase [Bacteroidia bacterium]|nr:AAA family ATPase [Bacteroidia bacterium]
MPYSDSKQAILKLKELLKTEKEAERKLFEENLTTLTIQQKINSGICWYPVEIKEDGYGMGDYPFLIIKRHQKKEIPHRFDGGKPVTLFSGNLQNRETKIQGTIHYVTPDTMKIIFYLNELPDWVDDGKIGVETHFDEGSYREMEKALNEAEKAEKNRLAQLRDIIYGSTSSTHNIETNFLFVNNLNQSQNRAVKNILQSNDIALVHGPPGTGKTTTLVQAIKELIKTEQQVLVCAPSNSAADLLTEKLAYTGVYVLRIGNLSRIDYEVFEHTVEEKVCKHTNYKRIKESKKQAEEFRRMANKYKRTFGFQEREQRRLLLKEAKNLVSEAITLENELIEELIDNAQAIVCTLVGSAGKHLENKHFKTVIIDEAAQAIEPACWVPLLKADKLVMAGDPYQLPATVKSAKASQEGLSISLMEKCIDYLPNVSLLEIQYRMNDAIMQFSNRFFYQNKLTSFETNANHLLQAFNQQPVEFIDTAGCGFEEEFNPETISLFNRGEAEILNKHLIDLTENLSENCLIGIISPYREQVNFLKEYLSPSYGLALINVDTIDSFQGREADVIYLSLTRSNSKNEIGFLKEYRRLNVALTRAKKKLVVIGDSATLGNDKFYNAFIDFCQQNNFYRSAWEFIN